MANEGKDYHSFIAGLEGPHPATPTALYLDYFRLLGFIVCHKLLLVKSSRNDIRPKKGELERKKKEKEKRKKKKKTFRETKKKN